MTRALVILVACLSLVAVACGEDKPTDTGRAMSGKLGGEGDQDAALLGKYLSAVHEVPTTDIEIVQAFSGGDPAAAQKGVDKLKQIATDGRAIATGFKGAKLRTFFVGYSDRVADVAAAYQRALDAPSDHPENAEELIQGVADAKKRLKVQDDKFLATMKDTLSSEQYKELTDQIQKLNERYKDAATG